MSACTLGLGRSRRNNWLKVPQFLSLSSRSPTHPTSLQDRFISLFDGPGPEKSGVAQHTHTRPISDNDGSHATQTFPAWGCTLGQHKGRPQRQCASEERTTLEVKVKVRPIYTVYGDKKGATNYFTVTFTNVYGFSCLLIHNFARECYLYKVTLRVMYIPLLASVYCYIILSSSILCNIHCTPIISICK